MVGDLEGHPVVHGRALAPSSGAPEEPADALRGVLGSVGPHAVFALGFSDDASDEGVITRGGALGVAESEVFIRGDADCEVAHAKGGDDSTDAEGGYGCSERPIAPENPCILSSPKRPT